MTDFHSSERNFNTGSFTLSSSFRGIFFLILIVLALPLVSGCGRDEHVWRQLQTVTVETPSGDVSGSSVTQVVALFGRQLMSANEVAYSVTGEATVVEVQPGRYLFALLRGSEERYYWAVAGRLGDKSRGEWLSIIPEMTDVAVLRPGQNGYPMLVTFDDPTDPKTIRQINPDDLEATFGPGYEIKSITVRMTNESVSDGRIARTLGWIDSLGDSKKMLDGASITYLEAPNRLANELSGFDFKRY